MRSVIEEIAHAEQQADEIRQNAAAQARELTLKAKEDAQKALSQACALFQGRAGAGPGLISRHQSMARVCPPHAPPLLRI